MHARHVHTHTHTQGHSAHTLMIQAHAVGLQTLDLLSQMTSPQNVRVIVAKLLDHLRTSGDDFLRGDLTARATALAEKYAPDGGWYLTTMATVFELGGDLVRPGAADALMRLIAEGTSVPALSVCLSMSMSMSGLPVSVCAPLCLSISVCT
jgi:hypothetical protein